MVMKNLVMMLNVRIEVAAVEKVTYPQSSSQEIRYIKPLMFFMLIVDQVQTYYWRPDKHHLVRHQHI